MIIILIFVLEIEVGRMMAWKRKEMFYHKVKKERDGRFTLSY